MRDALGWYDDGPDAVAEVLAGGTKERRKGYESGLLFLGTLGNNAPFVGLFGTVLGIVTAFRELASAAGSTNGMNNVMGGIAEALVATAVGILVALPAVIAYNAFQKKCQDLEENTQSIGNLVLAQMKSHETASTEASGRPGVDMAGTLGGGGSKRGIVSGINVTPLVDVCLVLLIILMVSLDVHRRAVAQDPAAEVALHRRHGGEAGDGDAAQDRRPALERQGLERGRGRARAEEGGRRRPRDEPGGLGRQGSAARARGAHPRHRQAGGHHQVRHQRASRVARAQRLHHRLARHPRARLRVRAARVARSASGAPATAVVMREEEAEAEKPKPKPKPPPPPQKVEQAPEPAPLKNAPSHAPETAPAPVDSRH